jgi:hypothetical protein
MIHEAFHVYWLTILGNCTSSEALTALDQRAMDASIPETLRLAELEALSEGADLPDGSQLDEMRETAAGMLAQAARTLADERLGGNALPGVTEGRPYVYAYQASENGRWYAVTDEERQALGIMLSHDPEGTAYSRWCADGNGEELPEDFNPERPFCESGEVTGERCDEIASVVVCRVGGRLVSFTRRCCLACAAKLQGQGEE